MTQAAQHTQYEEDDDDDVQLEGEASDPQGDLTETAAAPPEGFEKRGGDLLAFWEPASQGSQKKPPSKGSPPVSFIPLHVTMSDSKAPVRRGEPVKSSTLIHCQLTKPCRLKSANKSEGYKIFPEGTLFGIWAKPGMRELKSLAGVEVWMANDGFRNVGQQSDMCLFDIRSGKNGAPLKVKEDRREKSLPDKLKDARANVAQQLDDIPF
jgi:hypothetical protein